MIGGVRRRFGRSVRTEAVAPASAVESGCEPVEIELAAYADDCLVFGFVLVALDRLSDYLNEQESYELRDVLVVSLADGSASEAKTLIVERGELLAVRAGGPRGNAQRRLSGSDPIAQLRSRRPMVALTESWIEYPCEGEVHRGRVGTIIFNREAVDWIHLSADDEVRLPDLPAETRPGSHAKDMTGYIWTAGRQAGLG